MILSIYIVLSILLCMFSTIFSEELVELNSRNLITIRGPINHESVSDFMLKSGKVESKDLYIYISSPGGSVMEGMKIVDLIKKLPKIKGIKEIFYPGQNKYIRFKNNKKKEVKISKNILKDLDSLLK